MLTSNFGADFYYNYNAVAMLTRARLIKSLTLGIILFTVLRLAGIVELPSGLFVATIILDLVLAWLEMAALFLLARPVYRRHRTRHPPFDALIETLREVEPLPAPIFAVLEKELRMWWRVYRWLARLLTGTPPP